MKVRNGRRLFFWLTVLLISFHLVGNLMYLGGDLNIEQKDVAAHLKVGTKFYLQSRDLLRSAHSPWEFVRDFVLLFHQESMEEEHIWLWPRLVYLVSFPMAALLGATPRVLILSNSVWLAVLVFSVYLIGQRCMNPEGGFLSALVVSFFPGVYGMSRKYGLDFPLMAMVALNLYWLIRTEFFSRRAASFIFGCVLGLGLLVKMQLVVFLLGPLGFALGLGAYRALCGGRGSAPSQDRPAPSLGSCAVNVGITACVAASISALFWWGNIENSIHVFLRHAAEVDEFGGYVDPYATQVYPFLSPQYLSFYAVSAVIYISPFFFALSLILFPAFVRSSFRAKAFVLVWLVVPYVLWTLVEVKVDVFYLGSFPAFALIIGAGFASLRRKLLKGSLVTAAVLWGLFHFANQSFSVGPSPYGGCSLFSGRCLREDGYPMWSHPSLDNNLEEVASRFISKIDALEGENAYLRIGVLEFAYSIEDYLLVDCLEYFMESNNPSIYVYRSFFSPDSFLECMDSFNFIVVLEEGEKSRPDFVTFDNYFLKNQGAHLRKRYFASAEAFMRVCGTYREYELLDAALLRPHGVSAFLLKKPAFPVGDDTVVPATYLVSANVFIAYPYIGISDQLLHAPTIGDYDVLFPYDVEFPLVPPDRRDPSERYFSRYRLLFERGGRYGLYAGVEGRSTAGLESAVNGRELAEETRPRGEAADGKGVFLGFFDVDEGISEIELLGVDGFPVVENLFVREMTASPEGRTP